MSGDTGRLDVWAGPECSWLRVGDWACDQLALTGHDRRMADLDLLAGLGVKATRYPVLWGRNARPGEATDWDWAERRLGRLHELGIRPVVGLLHHGYGPDGMDPLDPGWPAAFARYAREVARRFPEVTEYLPINEPVTTARFGGLYGWWPPYGRDVGTFARLVLAQAAAHHAAVDAIRSVTPGARFLANEDLGRAMSSPACRDRAGRHGERRWLAFDLLAGRVDSSHAFWPALGTSRAARKVLDALHRDPRPPDVLGIDYYVTSDRYLDDRVTCFPREYHAGDEEGPYVDVEVVRVAGAEIGGFQSCIEDTWQRYGLPIALTEVHLAGEPDDQVAWWLEAVDAARRSIRRGIPVEGVTAWSTFGAFDWSSVLRDPRDVYAAGCFDVTAGRRPVLTRLGEAVRGTAAGVSRAAAPGWWRRADRVLYDAESGQQAA